MLRLVYCRDVPVQCREASLSFGVECRGLPSSSAVSRRARLPARIPADFTADLDSDSRANRPEHPPGDPRRLSHTGCMFCAACRRELPRPRRRTKWPARNRWFLRCPVFFPFKLRHCVVATVIARNCRCG